jgi:adenosine kinase
LFLFQWVLRAPKSTAFLGGVGPDEFGETQRKILLKEGVDCRYDVVPSQTTGSCAALITGKNRCLVANIGAAGHFRTSHVVDPAVADIRKSGKIFYCESFFVTVSMESLLILAHEALHTPGKSFAVNLSAKWVIDGHLKCLLELFPYANFIFGNEEEVRCLARNMGWKETQDTQKIAWRIALLPKLNPTQPRIVVVTQGSDPVILAVAHFNVDCSGKDTPPDVAPVMGGGNYKGCYCCGATSAEPKPVPDFVAARVKIQTFPVTQIPKAELKDTNGCGDSFVGGFLAAVVRGKTYEEAVLTGNKVAQVVARQSGCVFPATCDIPL